MGKKSKWNIWVFMAGIYFLAGLFMIEAEEASSVRHIPHESKMVIRGQLIQQIIIKYRDNQTFDKTTAYMNLRAEQLHRSPPGKSAAVLMEETFKKMQTVFSLVRPIVGSKNKDSYHTELFVKKVRKYLWLKNLCFLTLGIGKEHKEMLSYFYLSPNEDLKQELMRDFVGYFYPEVPDTSENSAWFAEMTAIFGELGYKLFDVAKFIDTDVSIP